MNQFAKMRVAIAHHWLVGMRGGEKVLEQICRVLPPGPMYTLVAQPSRLSPPLRERPIFASWLQQVPGATRQYKKLLPFFPQATESLSVRASVDFVVSSDASIIKGLSIPPGMPHVCYCHSPPRYLWDMQDDYRKSSEVGGTFSRTVFNCIIPYVREFDRQAAQTVTHFIANSQFVRNRIRAYYGRDAEVIHPPVYLDEFEISREDPDDFFLVVSQLVPYKRIDVAVSAFNQLKRKLVIIGDGPERQRLQRMAGPTISFLGSQPSSVLREHYQRCQAFVFPGIEDFGITPLEAQASGRPVIAYRAGGALESIRENVTGLFFNEQTPESLIAAVEKFDTEKTHFNPAEIRRNAERFDARSFRHQFANHLRKLSLLPA